MNLLPKLKQIVIQEISDEKKSLLLHNLLSKISSDYTIKYARKEKQLIYRVVVGSDVFQDSLSIC